MAWFALALRAAEHGRHFGRWTHPNFGAFRSSCDGPKYNLETVLLILFVTFVVQANLLYSFVRYEDWSPMFTDCVWKSGDY